MTLLGAPPEVPAIVPVAERMNSDAGRTDDRIAKLIEVVERQQEQVALLVNAVAMVLGEEMGKPVEAGQAAGDDGIERDWDGNPIG